MFTIANGKLIIQCKAVLKAGINDGIIQPACVSEEGFARLDSIRSFMIHKALKIKSLEMKRDAEVLCV